MQFKCSYLRVGWLFKELTDRMINFVIYINILCVLLSQITVTTLIILAVVIKSYVETNKQKNTIIIAFVIVNLSFIVGGALYVKFN